MSPYKLIPLVLYLFTIVCPKILQAEDVILHLKNEDRISGQLWEMTPNHILIETLYGDYSIERKFIRKIDFENETQQNVLVHLKNGEPVTGLLVNVDAGFIVIENEAIEQRLLWEDIQNLVFLKTDF